MQYLGVPLAVLFICCVVGEGGGVMLFSIELYRRAAVEICDLLKGVGEVGSGWVLGVGTDP
jgi:hypothetical protein